MRMKKLQGIVLPLLLVAGCSNPADNVPAAQVSGETNAPSAIAAPANAKSYVVTPRNSKIEFIGSKVTGSHNGGFTNFVGELKAADGKLLESGNRVVIATDSIWSDNGRLTGHLKSPDFFDVAKFPTAVFETTAISGEGTNSTVTGNLTLHGITKQISFPAAISVTPENLSVNAEFAINRFDFNMQYPGKADDLIRKEVVLKLTVNATPGKADFAPVEKAGTGSSSVGGR